MSLRMAAVLLSLLSVLSLIQTVKPFTTQLLNTSNTDDMSRRQTEAGDSLPYYDTLYVVAAQ